MVMFFYAHEVNQKYSRPAIEEQEFLDDRGRTVTYGRRRELVLPGDPGDQGTNVFCHQERYAPIFAVADALLSHLAASYDVDVDDDLRQSSRFTLYRRSSDPSFARVVSLRPVAAAEAPLILGFHDQPGSLRVLAGWFSEFDMWFCGCNACDEPWEDVADALEDVMLSVAERGTTERLDRRAWGRARYMLDPSGQDTWTGSIPKRMLRPEILEAARSSSQELEQGRWQPWTPRAATV